MTKRAIRIRGWASLAVSCHAHRRHRHDERRTSGVAGRSRYLYRAVDEYRQVIDVLLAQQRDTAAARRSSLAAWPMGPRPSALTPGWLRQPPGRASAALAAGPVRVPGMPERGQDED